jgi:hypothetical protein
MQHQQPLFPSHAGMRDSAPMAVQQLRPSQSYHQLPVHGQDQSTAGFGPLLFYFTDIPFI